MGDDEIRIDTVYGAWYVRATRDDDPRGRVWFRINVGSMTLSAYIPASQAVALAGKLLAAAGHDDPIPAGEATESDWATLEHA